MVKYPVLAGGIARKGIKKKAIADHIGICTRSLNNKMSGRVPFTLPESFAICHNFFPETDVEHLFSSEEAVQQGSPRAS